MLFSASFWVYSSITVSFPDCFWLLLPWIFVYLFNSKGAKTLLLLIYSVADNLDEVGKREAIASRRGLHLCYHFSHFGLGPGEIWWESHQLTWYRPHLSPASGFIIKLFTCSSRHGRTPLPADFSGLYGTQSGARNFFKQEKKVSHKLFTQVFQEDHFPMQKRMSGRSQVVK